MKIVVLDGHALSSNDNPWDPILPLGDVVVHEHTSALEVERRAQGAAILVINKVRLDADLLARLPNLQLIAVTATGFDCVDIAEARRRGIVVANVPEYGTDSVAQFVFAHLLNLCHHVTLHDEAVRAGEWTRCPDFSFWKTPLIELAGKVMGIVGFGRIGRRVGEIAHAFGMNVLAHDKFLSATPTYQPFAPVEIDELFARADVISLHCPLTAETTGLVNRNRLALVKPSVFLINTSRGPLIVEHDLAEALNAGRLAGAALDVVGREPITLDNPLLAARNCLITPHIAWATLESRRRLMQATADNIAHFLAGRPTNVVN